jgi:hypothetical protein
MRTLGGEIFPAEDSIDKSQQESGSSTGGGLWLPGDDLESFDSLTL